jgi:hypothetical protein
MEVNMSRAKKYFKKLVDVIGFELPKIEITPEKEEETINLIVDAIERWGMEDFAILFGSGFAPMSAIFGYTVLLPWAPVAGWIGVDNPWQYIAFFDNHENVKKILNRLHEDSKLSR